MKGDSGEMWGSRLLFSVQRSSPVSVFQYISSVGIYRNANGNNNSGVYDPNMVGWDGTLEARGFKIGNILLRTKRAKRLTRKVQGMDSRILRKMLLL